MIVRELVEETFMRRLSDHTKDVRAVTDQEFNEVWDRIGGVVDGLTKKTRLPGLTEDDLRSFYVMKTHQLLRRDKYDHTKNPRTFFGVAFTNLNRDINRVINYGRKLGMDFDYLDSLIELPHVDGFDVPEEEKNDLDAMIDQLEGRERLILIWAVEYMEQNNPVLVPLSRAILAAQT